MRSRKRISGSNSKALILLAPDFREGRTVNLLERLRQEGVSVSLVGLSTGLISGYHGMTVRPDVSLEQLPGTPEHRLVIIPDGKECVSSLLADPRVHHLIKTTLNNSGYVAAMREGETILEESGLVTSCVFSQFVWRKDNDMNSFATELVHRLE